MSPAIPLSPDQSAALAAAMDRLVPPVDGLPGAGTMGLAAEVERLAQRHGPYGQALSALAAALAAEPFAGQPGERQDARLRALESDRAGEFAALLDLVYLAYYGEPQVQRRIAWRGGALQPDGFPLAPFDEAIVDTTRRRAPFWRPA